MFGEINLLEEPGSLPTTFARQIVSRIYGQERANYLLTDDSKPSVNSKRTPMPAETVKLIRKAVRKKFNLEIIKFEKIWPKIRNSINGMGRFIRFKVGVNQRIESLTNEVAQLRDVFNNNNNNVTNNNATNSI